jgi:hypothetical protein
MAEFCGMGESAVAIAEHDFIIVIVVARDHEIGNSVAIEIGGRYMEQGSSPGQLKGPGALE